MLCILEKMASLPTIPTSFVPHQASSGIHRFRNDFSGAFGFFAYAMLTIALALSIGVFVYGRILTGTLASRDADLAKAEAAIDTATVESFVRLRDRLDASQALIDKHTAFSNLFSVIEAVLPANVRFKTLHLSADATGAAMLEGSGVARSFNALAAASDAFAADNRIKDVIFSKITVNPDSSVSFGFAASASPKLIIYSSANASANTNANVPSAPAVQSAVASSTKP